MAGLPQHHAFESSAARRRLAARRRKYLWRRAIALLILLTLLGGVAYGAWKLTAWLRSRSVEPDAPPVAALPFQPEKYLKVDLQGDTAEAYIALSPAANALRQVALVVGPQRAAKIVGEPITVAAFDLKVEDLPRAKNVVVLYQKLPTEGQPKMVPVGADQAVEAAGGEPDYLVWRIDPAKGLVPADYFALAAPMTPPAPTSIIVDKYLNVLWFYQEGQLAKTFRVATGKQIQGPRPTAATASANKLTPVGDYTIGTRVRGMPYYKEAIPALDPRNPLGTRWLGFSVYPGDGAAVWAIHGTNEPASVGHWASDGCVRMINKEIEWLFDQVQTGTPLKIISSEPKA